MSRCLQARAPRDKDSNSYIKIFAKIEWKDIQAKTPQEVKTIIKQPKIQDSSSVMMTTPLIFRSLRPAII
jgi:hypothetical protein